MLNRQYEITLRIKFTTFSGNNAKFTQYISFRIKKDVTKRGCNLKLHEIETSERINSEANASRSFCLINQASAGLYTGFFSFKIATIYGTEFSANSPLYRFSPRVLKLPSQMHRKKIHFIIEI